MAQRLAEYLEKADPAAMAYLSDRMVLMLEQEMTNATEIGEKFRLQFGLGIQQMQAGRPDSALNTFAALERSVQESGGRFDDRTRAGLRMRKAMAFLRLGEQ